MGLIMDGWKWKKLSQFIKEFDKHAYMNNPKEDNEFFDCWELNMAKALLDDAPTQSVRIAKIILALKDVSDIRIKID